ncbi:MAG: primosomal protein N' [Cyanobacteriota bacterium]|nr:primosomal protein N' [Cyanobacteriota bacterium]
MSAGIPGWLEVWVDSPQMSGCYTYVVPEWMRVDVGDLVLVPFGGQSLAGIVLGWLRECPADLSPQQVRPIEEVVMAGLLPPDCWELLQQVAAYYFTPLAQVIRTVLPAGLLTRSQRRIQLVGSRPSPSDLSLSPAALALLQLLQAKKGDLAWLYLKRQIPQASQALQELRRQGLVKSYWRAVETLRPKRQQAITLCDDTPEGLTPPQQELLLTLKRLGGDLWLSDFLAQTGGSRQIVQTLARKGRLHVELRESLRLGSQPPLDRDRPRALTPEQAEAVQTVTRSLGSPQTFLLHGVTGSGKTEVYLQTIAAVLQQGSSALVLVPEIGLTPQLTDRFRARFGSQVLVYHSGLSDGERFDSWRQMLRPQPQVVIGTRSAIFAPLPALGMIVLDEEHDESYKQDQPQPCYHARTVALWRSQQANCPVVLGSATPALETVSATRQGSVIPLTLTQRIPQQGMTGELPPIHLIDMRRELEAGNRSVFSYSLQQALQQAAAQQQQTILFVPRRGHSTFVLCRSCGVALGCRHCDVSLTFHQVGQQLRCHYCGDRQPFPPTCPHCASPYLKQFGSGTQKVVETLQQTWPELRVLRFDSDTTSRKGSHRELLEQFGRGEADVLVGTQMLTKGIDIPQVTLVGVVAADGLLHQSDFRASERTFQVLTQVAGRAGRGNTPSQVLIQTYLPEHPTLQAVQTYDYTQFVNQEMQHRHEARYPPSCALLLLRLSGLTPEKVADYAHRLGEELATLPLSDPVEVLGASPAQIERVSGWYRWQILLKGRDPLAWKQEPLANYLQNILHKSPSGIRLSVDVDPLRIG